jgi:LCP family protein required for cell wall assembly
VSTPVGKQPTWDDADGRGGPGRTRRSRAAEPSAKAITVEQLLARQDNPAAGGSTDRRRASRRIKEHPVRLPVEPAPVVRAGLPPVPGSPVAQRQAGLPPVPGAPARPPVPGAGAPLWAPAERPSRRSGPIPPLPGLAPAPADRAPRRIPRAADRAPVSPGRRRVVRALVALGAVLGVVLLYHLGLYFYVDQKIDRVDALATDGPEILAPALQAGDETYLVVGSGVPGQDGAASVSTLLASVSADGDRAVLVSFPPTALVDTPACRTADGDLRSPTTEAFASALLQGGPSCMVRAVQQLSGLRVDHYLGVDLTRLPGMVDALGGVPVCVTPSRAAAEAAQPLPQGLTNIAGDAAAGYLQPGATGSDVTGAAVAERAQRLLTSTLRAAMSTGTLTDPATLTRFLSRAANALTVDEQTTLGDLRVLAASLGDLSGDAVQRAGLPVAQVGYVPAATDQAYVLIDGEGTRTLFDAVIEDTRVPAELAVGADGAAPADGAEGTPLADAAGNSPPAAAPPAASTGEALTAAPDSITVDVLNGTGTRGLGATVAELLQAQGYGVGAVGNEAGTVNESVVRYGPGVLEQARTVAAAVPGAVLQASDAIGDTVQLVIGPGYSTVVPVTIGVPAAAAAAPADTPAPVVTEPAPVAC